MPSTIAITCGDPAGIGSEVALRAALDPGAPQDADLLLVGPPAVWDAAARLLGLDASWEEVAVVPRARGGRLFLLPAGEVDPGLIFCGRTQAACGRASHAAVERAVAEALAGRVDAVVTAPVDKAAWHAAGLPWPGHTGYLAHAAGVSGQAVMSFVAGELLIGLVTEHLPLARVPGAVDAAGVERALRSVDRALREWFDREAPRVAVCGLNPHAGEAGLLGAEDRDLILPAVETARASGLDASGPWPADTLFVRASRGEFDGVVAMYHDQGLIPAKLLAFGSAVNLTLGLPLVRTSPDHGTAYDRAGAGTADPGSMAAALDLASRLTLRAEGGG